MIGYSEILDAIRGAALGSTLAHAYLIYGPDGIGKSRIAKLIGRLIISPEDPDDVSRDIDIREVRPVKASIGVDEMRDIVYDSNFRPFTGDRRVIIIYEGDKMTTEAQNALLKTIEEPPAGLHFIILSERREALLPTIVSRCQNLRLYPLSRKYMEEYIRENHKVSEDGIEELVAISRGIPGEVDRFLKDEEQRRRYDSMFHLLEVLSTVLSNRDRNAVRILEMNELIRDDLEEYLTDFYALLRDIAVMKNGGHYKNLIFLYNEKRVQEIASKYSMTRLTHIMEVVEEGLDLLAPGRNINSGTIADYVLLKLLEER